MIEFLYSALLSPHGIILETTPGDVERLRQRLYSVRREARDPDLANLAFVPSPISSDTQLWIVKKSRGSPNNGPPQSGDPSPESDSITLSG